MPDIYNIKGMSCAACSARVESCVKALDGVESCAVNLLTNSMTVFGSADSEKIISAVKKAGYDASLNNNQISSHQSLITDNETPALKKRLFLSLGFLCVLMYISMGYTMWGLPLPFGLNEKPVIIALIQLFLTVAVIIINRKFFINGFKGIINRAPNMDTLVALGSASGFIYSLTVLFSMIQNTAHAPHLLHDLYFESSAMILALITLGKMLEARAKGKTTTALKSLMDLSPKTATVIIEENEKIIPVENVMVGDIFVVKPGESIPVDGIVLEGYSAVNEAMLSGESIPIDKTVASNVFAGTINQSGFLKCQATNVNEDTSISQIIKMVSDAAATKAPIAKIADKVSAVFVPVVMAIAVITILIWLITGQTVGFAIARGISVLVISCPCALGLATPVAIMVGNGIGAKNGILFKNASVLELAGKISAIALDKTGTITTGEPAVVDVIPFNITKEELLTIAYSLEKHSEHPLAKAIIKKSEELNIKAFKVTDFQVVAGNGLVANHNGNLLKGGSFNFLADNMPSEAQEISQNLAKQGKTPVFFVKNNTFCGIIAISDTIKPEVPKAIEELKNMGIEVIMITGDNKLTAQAFGKLAGVDTVYSEVLPDGKDKLITELKLNNRVAMVGDGINDAPALTRADIGIAIGTGTDVAIDSADIVLMKSNLLDVSAAIRLSRQTLKIIKQNLFWAFIYNCVGIPLAAGVFISILGWQLNPMFGAAAMSLSSFCVVSNSLRLNLLNIYNNMKDKKIKQKEKLKMSYKTILKIEGMMCPHCEARVKSTLENLEHVISAEVSHQNGTAIIESNIEMTNDLSNAVEAQGYKVTEIIK